MGWGFDRRLAVGGLAVAVVIALAGIGVTILWPEEKTLGWSLILAAALILCAWLCFETVQWFGRSGKALAVSIFLSVVVLGGLYIAHWRWGQTVTNEGVATSRERQRDLVRSFITSKNEYLQGFLDDFLHFSEDRL